MCYRIDIRLSFPKSQRSFFIYRCLNYMKNAVFFKLDIVNAITEYLVNLWSIFSEITLMCYIIDIRLSFPKSQRSFFYISMLELYENYHIFRN